MNEKIKQLAEQAELLQERDGDVYLLEHATGELEKFAELIVQECLDAIVATKDRPADGDLLFYSGLFTAIDGIKKRFGFK